MNAAAAIEPGVYLRSCLAPLADHLARPDVTVRLGPGAGARIALKMRRYANVPTLTMPWDR